MRDVLAERLLAEVMKWTPEDVAINRPDLQALATFKYDEYQQFSPGIRFVESLALWLNQFETDEERKIAYKFVRSRLVFISNSEMQHLVTIAFPDFIRPFLIYQTSKILNMPDRFVAKIANTNEYRILLRQSLFLGLSDGAHIDIFRRSNPEISHEQVWQAYEIPAEKIDSLICELSSELETLLHRKPIDNEKKFKMIFLLDDFSGSGISYFRKEINGDNIKYKGKIYKILSNLNDSQGELKKLVDLEDLYFCIVLYVATEKSVSYLKKYIDEWLKENNSPIKFKVFVIQQIPDLVLLNNHEDEGFISLLQKYFDPSIIDKHYSKGRHDEPYMGFDQCALPVVLNHNTPNNSVPLLWFEDNRKYRGLFPRVSRHRREL
ncbi:MAG: phosphoribosyltransferase-like protein [Bacillota bacterium]